MKIQYTAMLPIFGRESHGTGGTVNLKEGNVLFNDALNTFYLRLYGVSSQFEDNLPEIATVLPIFS